MIVTVTNENKSFFFDIEFPDSITVEKLKADLLAALEVYKPELRFPVNMGLFCNRLDLMLEDIKTIKESGVWNGDYLTMTEVQNG